MRSRKYIELKYFIAWNIGAVLCFFLYFSGIIPLYISLRRRYMKQYISVVLMYHRINDGNDDPDISVSTKNFEKQIAYLKNNFDVISLDELIDRLERDHRVNVDTVAITFDDGFKDNFTNAYPLLRKYDIPAAVFVTTGFINKDSKMLNNEDITCMQKGNITFGAHTVSHKPLSEVDRNISQSEIKGSKSALEKIIHMDVKYFAYPYGKRNRDFNDQSVQLVKEAGYRAAFSTDNGCINSDSNLFALKRIGTRNFPLFVLKGRVSGIFENKILSVF